jgi:hypothetical protein
MKEEQCRQMGSVGASMYAASGGVCACFLSGGPHQEK